MIPSEKEGASLTHSARYLAAMQRKSEARAEKRKRDEEERDQQEEERRKRAKVRAETLAEKMETVKAKAESAWRKQIEKATHDDFKKLYGMEWERHMATDFRKVRGTLSTEEPQNHHVNGIHKNIGV